MYIPYNTLTKPLMRYIFIECAGWSVLMNVKWILFKNCFNLLDDNKIQNFFKKNIAVRFIYQHVDKNGVYLLIGYNYNSDIKTPIDNTFYNYFSIQFIEIINIFSQIEWNTIDFNMCFLIWDISFQQCISEFLDVLSGGMVESLPIKWKAISRKENWHEELENSQVIIEKNFKRFINWKNKEFVQGETSDFTLEFIIWYENQFFLKKF